MLEAVEEVLVFERIEILEISSTVCQLNQLREKSYVDFKSLLITFDCYDK